MKKLPKRYRVPDGKRFSIITDKMDRCIVCGRRVYTDTDDLFRRRHLHEIFGGTGRRELSKYYGLVVPLCYECHEGDNGVHKNRVYDIALKEEGQKAFEEHYPDEDFLEVFGRNYL